jgi:hypothetical protein
MRLLLLVVFTEAITQLIFRAALLQPIRVWLIDHTPFLKVPETRYSTADHLLECKYCVSVWVGMCSAILYQYWDYQIVQVCVCVFVLHRLSNLFHLGYSYLNDKQMDLRIARRKGK